MWLNEVQFRKLLLIGFGSLLFIELLKFVSQARFESILLQSAWQTAEAQKKHFAWQQAQHSHKCPNCGTRWQHSNANGGNRQAHQCPRCGARGVYETEQEGFRKVA